MAFVESASLHLFFLQPDILRMPLIFSEQRRVQKQYNMNRKGNLKRTLSVRDVMTLMSDKKIYSSLSWFDVNLPINWDFAVWIAIKWTFERLNSISIQWKMLINSFFSEATTNCLKLEIILTEVFWIWVMNWTHLYFQCCRRPSCGSSSRILTWRTLNRCIDHQKLIWSKMIF